MRRQATKWGRTVGLALAALLALSVALASVGGAFDLTWWSVDGGGGRLQGGSYALVGAIGQADAGVLSGGAYSLEGGFLSGPVQTGTPLRSQGSWDLYE